MNIKWYMFLLIAVFIIFTDIHAQEQIQPQNAEKQATLVYSLVVDNSGSLRSQIDKVVETGKLIVSSNKSDDQTFIVRFVDSENIRVIEGLSSNKTTLTNALESMYVEGGSSAIIDAVYVSAQRLVERDQSKIDASQRALILMTDGDERGSFYRLENLFTLLREKNIKVYVIGFTQVLKQQGVNTQERAITFLNKLAESSGGRAFFPNSMAQVKNIADRLLDEIRNQK